MEGELLTVDGQCRNRLEPLAFRQGTVPDDAHELGTVVLAPRDDRQRARRLHVPRAAGDEVRGQRGRAALAVPTVKGGEIIKSALNRHYNCSISHFKANSQKKNTHEIIGSGEPPTLLQVSSWALSSVAVVSEPGKMSGGWGGVNTVRL